MLTRVSPSSTRCQRWPWLALAALLPVSASAAEPVKISNPSASIDAGTGRLRIDVDVQNTLPVAIDSVVLLIGSEKAKRKLALRGTIDAGTTARLSGEGAVGNNGESFDVQMRGYRVAGALSWADARRLLAEGGAAGERNFLRQLHMPSDTALPGPALDAPIPSNPTMDEVVLWTARVLWVRCRDAPTESLEELRKRASVGALEDGFGLLRAAWLVRGRDNAPLSAAIPRNARRFEELLGGEACPIAAPEEPLERRKSSNLRPADESLADRENWSIALWIGAAITIFGAGILIGRRRRHD